MASKPKTKPASMIAKPAPAPKPMGKKGKC